MELQVDFKGGGAKREWRHTSLWWVLAFLTFLPASLFFFSDLSWALEPGELTKLLRSSAAVCPTAAVHQRKAQLSPWHPGAAAMTTGETCLTPRANSFTLLVNGQLERVLWGQSHRGRRDPACAAVHKAPGHPAPAGPTDQLPLSPPPYACGQPRLSGDGAGRRRVWGDVGRFHLGTACRASGPQGLGRSTGGCCEWVVLNRQARRWGERGRAAAAVTALLPAPLLLMPFLPPGFFPDSQHHHPKVSLEEGICLLVCLFILCLIRGRRQKKSHKQSARLFPFPFSVLPPPFPSYC